MVGVVDGEYAVRGCRSVEVPLRAIVYQTYLSSLRGSRVATAGREGGGGGRREREERFSKNVYSTMCPEIQGLFYLSINI